MPGLYTDGEPLQPYIRLTHQGIKEMNHELYVSCAKMLAIVLCFLCDIVIDRLSISWNV